MKRKVVKTQTLISGLFTYLLTLLLVMLYLCLGFGIGIFNNRSIISSMNNSNYFNEVYQEIKLKAEDIISESGLPTSMVDDVITLERVYVGGKNYVEATLKREQPQLNLDKLHDDLKKNIDVYLQEEGIIRSEELNNGMEEVITAIEQEYLKGIKIQFVDYVMDYKADYNKIMTISIPILLILIAILCYFIIRMHSYKHRGVRYIAYALISSSSMTVISSAFLLITKSYKKIEIVPEYYYSFLTHYLKWDIIVFTYIGGIGMILSVVLISFIDFMKNRITDG